MNKPKKPIQVEGKTLPQSNEIERTVLGTIILESTCLDRLIKDFSVNLFYEPKHRILCNAIIELYKESKPVDLLTIVKKLQENSLVDESGGIAYISSLTQGIASTANVEYHIRILQEEALRRNVILLANKAIQKSFDPTEDIFEVFNDVQHRLDTSLKNVINYEIRSVAQIHSQVISESLQLLKSGKKSGVPTGLRLLDNVTNGWQKTDLIILAGRPGSGKSSFAISVALFPAVEMQIPVAMFSLEMSAEQFVSRMQSYYSEIDVSKIVKKQLTEDDIIQIERKTEKFKKAPIYIDDTPNISLLDLKGKVRKLVKENNVQLVIVDYLQLMRSGIKTQSRELEISEISRGLKALAKECQVPVIALSQLSRAVEATSDKKPMLSHLRESGQLEADADMVGFCFRPDYYGFESYDVGNTTFDGKGLFMLIIAKHRNGELGEIPLRFVHEQTKIVNYSDNNSTFVQSSEPNWSNMDLKPNSEFSDDRKDTWNVDVDETPF
jgi:replicative DNA helicase